ncbi:MAG: 3-hydroxyacyl-CoA dehydrogenase, partial [Betaproteobacteria bacterium]|nr:3-hydroxyacyl-CoA dehydrogenase [Betaproteobacteria bacterium]
MNQELSSQHQTCPSQIFQRVGVVGAGAMGRGIAQIIAQVGIVTLLHDSDRKAALAAQASILSTWAMMQEKGRLSAQQRDKGQASLRLAETIEELADCDLIIEAIVERLDVKQALFRQLEGLVATTSVLASNTSSLSVAAMASCLKHPERVAGYHFFNPVPLMKIVEVVRAAKTDDKVVEALKALATTVGHRAVVCGDTPGFIVNHAGRGYGPESLRALGEAVAPVQVIDRILREQVQFEGQGFKLGPFELMDLTAIDVSHPVMESIYHQYYEEARYRPSVLTAQRLAAGLFGRKTGEGFYRYVDSKKQALSWPCLLYTSDAAD